MRLESLNSSDTIKCPPEPTELEILVQRFELLVNNHRAKVLRDLKRHDDQKLSTVSGKIAQVASRIFPIIFFPLYLMPDRVVEYSVNNICKVLNPIFRVACLDRIWEMLLRS